LGLRGWSHDHCNQALPMLSWAQMRKARCQQATTRGRSLRGNSPSEPRVQSYPAASSGRTVRCSLRVPLALAFTLFQPPESSIAVEWLQPFHLLGSIRGSLARGPLSSRQSVQTVFPLSGIRLWGVLTGSELCILRGSHGSMSPLSFSSDGEPLASISNIHGVSLWDVGAGSVSTLRGSRDPFSASFSPDGKLLPSMSNGAITQWDVATSRELRTLKETIGDVVFLTFSPDGTKFATAHVKSRRQNMGRWCRIGANRASEPTVIIPLNRLRRNIDPHYSLVKIAL
jgi:hypothetical protein